MNIKEKMKILEKKFNALEDMKNIEGFWGVDSLIYRDYKLKLSALIDRRAYYIEMQNKIK